jgi:hypothetical protein
VQEEYVNRRIAAQRIMLKKGLEVTYSVVMILFHIFNIEKVKHLQYPKAVQGRKRLQ